MAKKSVKEPKEKKSSKKSNSSGIKGRAKSLSGSEELIIKPSEAMLKAETADDEIRISSPKIEITGEVFVASQISGSPSLIQSNFGKFGNFELTAPLSKGGIAHYWRNNDHIDLPWFGPIIFGQDLGGFAAVSLIQSNFGVHGNLELAAVDRDGSNLLHFWRDSGPSFDWHGPNYIAQPSSGTIFSGNPSMIQSCFGGRGNFDLIVPLAEGGLAHYWRDNDDPSLPWYGPFKFGSPTGIVYEAVTLIQSNFGDAGNLELIALSRDQIAFFWRESSAPFRWWGPFPVDAGASGTPCMIQSRFGAKGNFELVVPLKSGGMAYYWRDNDHPELLWHRPIMFGSILGQIEAVTFIQSKFGYPGNFELIAQSDGQLVFFWRDSGPDLRWNGPYFSLGF